MSLAHILLPPPTPNGLDEWMLQHLAAHQAIINAAFTELQAALTLYPIYPFDKRTSLVWLENHQQMHDDQNALLNIIGNDLSSVDFDKKKELEAWMYLHWTEHQAAASTLGLGI